MAEEWVERLGEVMELLEYTCEKGMGPCDTLELGAIVYYRDTRLAMAVALHVGLVLAVSRMVNGKYITDEQAKRFLEGGMSM